MIEVNDSNFEQEVIEASKTKPVMVDFFAEWCGSCKLMAPIVEEVDGESKGAFLVVKANVEQAPLAVEKHDVMSLPTVLVFKDGQVIKTAAGSQSKEALLDLMK
jgi:thioredoxin 1